LGTYEGINNRSKERRRQNAVSEDSQLEVAVGGQVVNVSRRGKSAAQNSDQVTNTRKESERRKSNRKSQASGKSSVLFSIICRQSQTQKHLLQRGEKKVTITQTVVKHNRKFSYISENDRFNDSYQQFSDFSAANSLLLSHGAAGLTPVIHMLLDYHCVHISHCSL